MSHFGSGSGYSTPDAGAATKTPGAMPSFTAWPMDSSFAPHIFIESFFVTDAVRDLVNEGYATFVPSNFEDIIGLVESGAVNGSKKSIHKGKIVFA